MRHPEFMKKPPNNGLLQKDYWNDVLELPQ